MSLQKTVTIIGGGIAGLSAAVFLNEKDFKVTLLEASPKSGGRAYSFFDKEISNDKGKDRNKDNFDNKDNSKFHKPVNKNAIVHHLME